MGEKTRRNLYQAFVGEAKAHFRLLAYAEKAEEEGFPQIAALFRAVAEASGVFYPRFIREAEEEGDRRAAIAFSQARDVEEGHATLYKHALRHMIADTTPVYYVCEVCGYVAEGEAPERCPVCNAPRKQFRQVT